MQQFSYICMYIQLRCLKNLRNKWNRLCRYNQLKNIKQQGERREGTPLNYTSYSLLVTITRVKLTNNHDNTPENVYYVDTNSLEHPTTSQRA